MSLTLNLRPFNGANPQSFNPNVHFAHPVLSGARVELIGDTRAALRTLDPEHADARVYKIAQTFQQGHYRVDATVKAVQVVHEQLRQNAILSSTMRMEAEEALLTFVQRVISHIEKNLYGPFAYVWGGVSRLIAIKSALIQEKLLSAAAAQTEQLELLSPHCGILTLREAQTILKAALEARDDIKKGFLLRMDANQPSHFYLVEGIKRCPDNRANEYTFRENKVTFHQGTYTLHFVDSDPQHLAFIGPNGEKKNEWRNATAFMSALRTQYGTAISVKAAAPDAPPQLPKPPAPGVDVVAPSSSSIGSQAASAPLTAPALQPTVAASSSAPASTLGQAAHISPVAIDLSSSPASNSASSAASTPAATPHAFSAPVSPSSNDSASALVQTYLARAQSAPAPEPAVQASLPIDSLQRAIEAGLCNTEVGPLAVCNILRRHSLTITTTKVGAVNFMLRKDITNSLYIELQLCTSVGEFSEDFNYDIRSYEIEQNRQGEYLISDAETNKKWPFRTKKWTTFGSMMRHFFTNCGAPIYNARAS